MKDPGTPPTAAEFGLLRAFLARNKFTQSWIQSVIGNAPAGKTRAQITELLKAAIKVLPKKQ